MPGGDLCDAYLTFASHICGCCCAEQDEYHSAACDYWAANWEPWDRYFPCKNLPSIVLRSDFIYYGTGSTSRKRAMLPRQDKDCDWVSANSFLCV
eukprot:COSAG06_NODE_3331_length_5493_cov_4.197220_1_plen_95_part_00